MTDILMKTVIDCETGIETVLPLTEEEIQQFEIDKADYELRKAAQEEAAAAKAAAKASAEAKLAALGLTPEEIAALR